MDTHLKWFYDWFEYQVKDIPLVIDFEVDFSI